MRFASKVCFLGTELLAAYSAIQFIKLPSEAATVTAARQRAFAQTAHMRIDPERAKQDPEIVEFIRWTEEYIEAAGRDAPLTLGAIASIRLARSAILFGLGM